MRQIRENIWEISWSDLGQPLDKGFHPVEGLGEVFLDIADFRYASEHIAKGHEPVFFVGRAPAMGGHFIVMSRQHAA